MGSIIHTKFPMQRQGYKLGNFSLWRSFIRWCEGQSKNRFLWMSFMLMSHCCVITGATVSAIVMSGNSVLYWPGAIGGLMACLVVCVSGAKTKIMLPVYFASVAVDLLIMFCCLLHGIDFSSMYR